MNEHLTPMTLEDAFKVFEEEPGETVIEGMTFEDAVKVIAEEDE